MRLHHCFLFFFAFASIPWQPILTSPESKDDDRDTFKGRISYGQEVSPMFKYPFAVRMFWLDSEYPDRRRNWTRCGGVILNRNWILTAAHCVDFAGNLYTWAAGDHNVSVIEETEQDLYPKQIIVHEKYTSLGRDPSGRWDIAVVRVEPQIRFTKYVQPINIPRCNEDPWYPEATAIGWGTACAYNLRPSLTEGKVLLVPLDVCQKIIEQEQGKPVALKNQLCSSDKDGAAPGPGDSGSPSFQLREKDKVESGYFLLGLVSGPAGNDHELYTKVADYAGWIHRRISGCGNHPTSKIHFSNATLGTRTPFARTHK